MNIKIVVMDNLHDPDENILQEHVFAPDIEQLIPGRLRWVAGEAKAAASLMLGLQNFYTNKNLPYVGQVIIGKIPFRCFDEQKEQQSNSEGKKH